VESVEGIVRFRKRETVEEKKFATRCRNAGYVCYKLSMQGSRGEKGFNDRLVFAPYGVTHLFEFKREGKKTADSLKPGKLQAFRHRILKNMGHNSDVVYRSDEAWKILRERLAQARKKAEAS
jgi:hypothetical protein